MSKDSPITLTIEDLDKLKQSMSSASIAMQAFGGSIKPLATASQDFIKAWDTLDAFGWSAPKAVLPGEDNFHVLMKGTVGALNDFPDEMTLYEQGGNAEVVLHKTKLVKLSELSLLKDDQHAFLVKTMAKPLEDTELYGGAYTQTATQANDKIKKELFKAKAEAHYAKMAKDKNQYKGLHLVEVCMSYNIAPPLEDQDPDIRWVHPDKVFAYSVKDYTYEFLCPHCKKQWKVPKEIFYSYPSAQVVMDMLDDQSWLY